MPLVISGDSPNFSSVSATTLSATTLTNVTNISSNAADTPVILGDSGTNYNTCRAWVNFNGTSTVAIRADFNVSSITDNGTGDYTVNFTTAMPDADYSAVSNLGTATTTTTSTPYTAQPSGTGTTAFSTTGYRLWSRQGANVADTSLISVAIFR